VPREVQQLVAEREHGGTGGERGRNDESVIPQLDASCDSRDDPVDHLKYEMVCVKTVSKDVGGRVADRVVMKPEATRGLEMLVAIQARRHRAECATYESHVSVVLILSASASASPPSSPIWFP
jgi:hypothetical protein